MSQNELIMQSFPWHLFQCNRISPGWSLWLWHRIKSVSGKKLQSVSFLQCF